MVNKMQSVSFKVTNLLVVNLSNFYIYFKAACTLLAILFPKVYSDGSLNFFCRIPSFKNTVWYNILNLPNLRITSKVPHFINLE